MRSRTISSSSASRIVRAFSLRPARRRPAGRARTSCRRRPPSRAARSRRSARPCRRRSRARARSLPSRRFVVKNGSNARRRVSSSIPTPVSVTRMTTYDPGRASGSVASCSSIVTFAVVTSSRPPLGIASLALSARLTSACSSWLRSATAHGFDAVGAMSTVIDSEITCSSRPPIDETTSFRLTIAGSRICLRPNASSWRGRSAACSAACTIRSALSRVELARVRVADEQLGVAADRGQHVVEVVGDTAGEPAERLEPLRVQELVAQPVALRLGQLPLGDVVHEALDVERLALLVAHEVHLVLHPHDGSVGLQVAVLLRERTVAAAHARRPLANTRSRSSGCTMRSTRSGSFSQSETG